MARCLALVIRSEAEESAVVTALISVYSKAEMAAAVESWVDVIDAPTLSQRRRKDGAPISEKPGQDEGVRHPPW